MITIRPRSRQAPEGVIRIRERPPCGTLFPSHCRHYTNEGPCGCGSANESRVQVEIPAVAKLFYLGMLPVCLRPEDLMMAGGAL